MSVCGSTFLGNNEVSQKPQDGLPPNFEQFIVSITSFGDPPIVNLAPPAVRVQDWHNIWSIYHTE